MKKSILITLLLVGFGIFSSDAQQQAIGQKEAKKIADDINLSLEKLSVEIEHIDWKAFSKFLDQTIIAVDQNTDALTEIAKNINMDKVTADLQKLATHIEKSLNNEKLEKQLKELGEKLEKVISEAEKK